MSLSPFLLVSCSFLLLAFLLLITPVLRSNQKLLISAASALMMLSALAAVAAGVWTVSNGVVNRVILPLGLPDLPFHIRLDRLSGFFLVVIGLFGFFRLPDCTDTLRPCHFLYGGRRLPCFRTYYQYRRRSVWGEII